MTRRQDCRKRLVEAALKLFASQGYHATGIADILRESGCKRGTLYYYFSSKEELGYAAIDEALRLVREHGAVSHLYTSDHPIDRLHKALDDLPSDLKLGSPDSFTAGVAARMAAVHEGFRQHLLERQLRVVRQELERMVHQGVAEGQIADSVNPDQLAHVVIIVSHGAHLAALLGQPQAIWEDARHWMKEYLNSLRR